MTALDKNSLRVISDDGIAPAKFKLLPQIAAISYILVPLTLLNRCILSQIAASQKVAICPNLTSAVLESGYLFLSQANSLAVFEGRKHQQSKHREL